MIQKYKVESLRLTLSVDFENILDVNESESAGKFSPFVCTDDIRVK